MLQIFQLPESQAKKYDKESEGEKMLIELENEALMELTHRLLVQHSKHDF
jgi:hypothetical protein